MEDLASRLNGRIQLSTDGHSVYLNAVRGAFKGDVDYAQLVKVCDGAISDRPELSRAKALLAKN